MNNKTYAIIETNFPNIEINGTPYILLCDYISNKNIPTSVYVQDNGHDVAITQAKNGAIVGLFSVDNKQIKQLFDYVESTISKKNGFICYEKDSMPKYLNDAMEKTKEYPIISYHCSAQKPTQVAKLLLNLQRQKTLNPSLRREIQAHTVAIEYKKEHYNDELKLNLESDTTEMTLETQQNKDGKEEIIKSQLADEILKGEPIGEVHDAESVERYSQQLQDCAER